MKKFFMIFMAFTFAFSMAACEKSGGKAAPENGVVFATIDGEELHYDPAYYFRISYFYVPDEPGKVMDNTGITAGEGALFMELAYLEADKNIEDLDEKIRKEIEYRQEYTKQYDHPKKMQAEIMAAEGLSEEEYWQNLEPFIEKNIVILEYSEKMYDSYFEKNPDASDEEAVAFYREELQKLMKKYHAEIRH